MQRQEEMIMNVFGIRNYLTHEGEEKTEFTRCGVAFPRKTSKGFVLKLHAHNLKGEYLLSPRLQCDSEDGGDSEKQNKGYKGRRN